MEAHSEAEWDIAVNLMHLAAAVDTGLQIDVYDAFQAGLVQHWCSIAAEMEGWWLVHQ